MAPRRSSIRRTTARSSEAVQRTEEAHSAGAAPVDEPVPAGVPETDGRLGAEATALPATRKAAIDTLEAAVAELRQSSAERLEVSSCEARCPMQEAQEVLQEAAMMVRPRELRQRLSQLRGAAREQFKVSHVLGLVQTSAEQAANRRQAKPGRSEARAQRDTEWLAALRASQETAVAVAHETSKHLDEVDMLCASLIEDAQSCFSASSKAARSTEAMAAAEEHLARESLEARELRADMHRQRVEQEKQAQAARRETEALRRELLLGEKLLAREKEARVACEGEVEALLQKSRRGLEPPAKEPDVARHHGEVQELQAKLSLLEARAEAEARAQAQVQSESDPPAPGEVPLLQIGVSRVADLVTLLFGSTDRALRAEDLRVLNSSTITSLLQREARRVPARSEQTQTSDKLEVALYGDDSGPETNDDIELDETMEWLMGSETGSRHGHDGSRCQSPRASLSEDEEIEWDLDSAHSACPGFIADALGRDVDDLLLLLQEAETCAAFSQPAAAAAHPPAAASSCGAALADADFGSKHVGVDHDFVDTNAAEPMSTHERCLEIRQDDGPAQGLNLLSKDTGDDFGSCVACITGSAFSESPALEWPSSVHGPEIPLLPGLFKVAMQEHAGTVVECSAGGEGPELHRPDDPDTDAAPSPPRVPETGRELLEHGEGPELPRPVGPDPDAAPSPPQTPETGQELLEPGMQTPIAAQATATVPPTDPPIDDSPLPGEAAENPKLPKAKGAVATTDEPRSPECERPRRLLEPENEQEPITGGKAFPQTKEPKPCDPQPVPGQLWEVVGGGDFGGIRVREGEGMTSEFFLERLTTGSLVKELGLQEERLFFEKLSGEGPDRGWVTIRIPGKELVVRCSRAKEDPSLVATSAKGKEAETAQPPTVAASEESIREEFESYQRQHADKRSAEKYLRFHQCLQEKDVAGVERMLLRRVPVDLADNTGKTALAKAVSKQSEALCKLLLTYSARPDWPPQRSAAEAVADLKRDRRKSPVITLFEDGRARQLRCRALHEAAMANSTDMILALAQTGSSRSSQAQLELEEDFCSLDDDGWTPLHLSLLAGGHLSTIVTLLQARASPNAPDGQGEPPLMLAVRSAQDSITCCLLLDQRAELMRRSPKGETALDLVTRAGARVSAQEAQEELRKMLLSYATREWWALAEAEGGLLQCAHSDGRWGGEGDAAGGEPGLRLLLGPASPSDRPKVSVICPTSPSRGEFHAQLLSCFKEQSYPEKELIVIDTGPEPSSFFLQEEVKLDPEVHHKWTWDQDRYDPERPQDGYGASSIGWKRNRAIRLATGTIIAHFDDDDFYGPNYLEQMVYLLLRHGADVVKLSSFFVFECQSGQLGYCHPESSCADSQDTSFDEFIWGCGFSYVYRRSAAVRWPFGPISFGEDFDFIQRLHTEGYSICLWPDLDGICLHMQHGRNTSQALCNDPVPLDMLSYMDISGCSAIQDTLANWPRRDPPPGGPPSVMPGLEHRRRSDMLDLAFEILHRRSRFPCSPVGLGPVIVEARAPATNRSLDIASPAAQWEWKRKLDIQDETGVILTTCLVPWSATIGEARSCAARLPELRAPRRTALRDGHRALRDEQLILGRRCLQVSVS